MPGHGLPIFQWKGSKEDSMSSKAGTSLLLELNEHWKACQKEYPDYLMKTPSDEEDWEGMAATATGAQ